jgi:hypothetical protein
VVAVKQNVIINSLPTQLPSCSLDAISVIQNPVYESYRLAVWPFICNDQSPNLGKPLSVADHTFLLPPPVYDNGIDSLRVPVLPYGRSIRIIFDFLQYFGQTASSSRPFMDEGFFFFLPYLFSVPRRFM